ncbi:hypothetical protein [Prescottella subtropica]|uniref:hypothetical protein n=1 Tax=Prescottella subtropica TaxID=2545757 RepID=UPI0010FA14E1|nr:hypothetical protein [Prescottella subtropica]
MSIRRSVARGAAIAVSTAALAVGAAVTTAGTASAAPVPMLSSTGYNIVPVPQGACHGTVAVGFESVSGRTDQVEVTFTPNGTYGAIAGCEIPVSILVTNGIAPFMYTVPAMAAGGRTSTIVTAGAGVSMVHVAASVYVGGLPSWGVGGYLWLQP